MNDIVWFENICHKNKFQVSDNNLKLLQLYVDSLIEWNQKINLISRQDIGKIWSRHILGSVSFLFKNKFQAGAAIVDIGTGGGLPGIPIAILQENTSMLLIDSIQKKISAVKDILGRLQLSRISTIMGRAEDVGKGKDFSNKYDYVIARAVGPIVDIVRWGQLFLKESVIRSTEQSEDEFINTGSIVMLKGGDLTAEIESARIKCKPKSLSWHSITINGEEAMSDLYDKKVVIVQP